MYPQETDACSENNISTQQWYNITTLNIPTTKVHLNKEMHVLKIIYTYNNGIY